ncbi:hypothetical protein DRN75_02025 [Nanoarchaeota archaeon]|nr:MAG: hypothetical protein DRN75_02025 [Nanoarchaeota archaeon]
MKRIKSRDVYAMLEYYGIKKRINAIFFVTEGGKVFMIPKYIDVPAKIYSLGLCIGKIEKEGFRFTIEGAQIFYNLATKQILELNDEQLYDWVRGINTKVNVKDGYYILKYKDDIVGGGKVKNGVLWNFVKKNRRIKKL